MNVDFLSTASVVSIYHQVLLLVCQKISLDWSNMAWIVLSRRYFDKNEKCESGMMVDSVDILMLSLEPDNMFVEVDIMSNIFFVGSIYCSELDRITESRRM